MAIMDEDVEVRIEHLPDPKGKKKWLDKQIVKPLPYRWTVFEGKHIFSYGYTHTEKQARKIATKTFVDVIRRKNRNIL